MAYWLGVYAPTTGVDYVSASAGSWSSGNVTPLGMSQQCISKSVITTSIDIYASISDGYSLSQWTVNIDGSKYYLSPGDYNSSPEIQAMSNGELIIASGSYTNVQVSISVTEDEPTYVYYYATLMFNANGGSGAPSSMSEESTSEIIRFQIPSKTPSKSGYTFVGWSESTSGSGTLYDPGDTYACYGSESDETYYLYAVWEAVTYYASLKYNANGGSGAPSTQYESSADGTRYVQFIISQTTPTRSGYSFSGWATNSSGTGTIYQPGETYTVSGSTSSTAYTLYAVWDSVTYYATLSYDANNGTGAPSTQSGSSTTSSIKFTIPSSTPSRSGYVFSGWSTNSSGTGTLYQAGDTYTVTGSNDSPGVAYTLYAAWSEDTSGYIWIYSNGWKKAILWIYSSGWKRTRPWVYTSGWKQGN